MVLRVLKGPGLAFLALLAFFWLATAVNMAFGFLDRSMACAGPSLFQLLRRRERESRDSVTLAGLLVRRSRDADCNFRVYMQEDPAGDALGTEKGISDKI